MKQARKKALDTPAGHLGVCTTHGITCAICSKVQDWSSPFRAAHWARKYARFCGWHYLPRWGWVCGGCVSSIPGAVSLDHAARGRQPARATGRRQSNVHRTGNHNSNLKRLQVELRIK